MNRTYGIYTIVLSLKYVVVTKELWYWRRRPNFHRRSVNVWPKLPITNSTYSANMDKDYLS